MRFKAEPFWTPLPSVCWFPTPASSSPPPSFWSPQGVCCKSYKHRLVDDECIMTRKNWLGGGRRKWFIYFSSKQTNRNAQGNILIYVNIYFYPLNFIWSGGFYSSREISKHCPYQKGVILCSCTDKHRCMCDIMRVFMRKLTVWISIASPCLRWLCLWVWKGYLKKHIYSRRINDNSEMERSLQSLIFHFLQFIL